MSTLKYKTTERYSMGWTDPRGLTQRPSFRRGSLLRVHGIATAFKHTSTETLRNLWLARWGQRAATADEVHAAYAEADGVMEVLQELYNRDLMKHVVNYVPERHEQTEHYVLEKEAHADC